MVSLLAPHHTNGNKISGPVMPATILKPASSNTKDDPAQSKRFIESRARETDETAGGADLAFKKIAECKETKPIRRP
jgi:hypothetical protein